MFIRHVKLQQRTFQQNSKKIANRKINIEWVKWVLKLGELGLTGFLPVPLILVELLNICDKVIIRKK